ncbi:MAG: sulfite exporter TauE/SafE family protein [Pseudarcicella sp.]|nr:sulfite exporter TauE/SafE family protein [Pseudarcicella sp.]MBP6410413.1 sulfite exporter TauE/SafE family protein [Pseudarcicella sp.]
MFELIIFIILIGAISFLYSSVGHGGASGYLALMAVLGFSTAVMKPSALLLNQVVSLISFIGFLRAGHFRLKLFLPFAVASIPLAYIGGQMVISDDIYKKILAICILISTFRIIFFSSKNKVEKINKNEIPLAAALFTGGTIGLISGMIGIGGGIILSPLLLTFKWATVKETAAVSALFIFVNSISGFVAFVQKNSLTVDLHLQYGIFAALLGGLLGTYYGSQKFNTPTLRILLAVGLTIASGKLLFT